MKSQWDYRHRIGSLEMKENSNFCIHSTDNDTKCIYINN